MINLKEQSHKMAKVYQRNEKIAGVLLAGSVSRGWEDSHSDIELNILWNEAPNDEDRLKPIKEVKGEVIDFFPYEDEEWSETYLAAGIKFEISNFLVKTVEDVIRQVVQEGNINYDLQCLAASVHDGHVLYEKDDILLQLKELVKEYPVLLAEYMILENLELGSRWNNRRALFDREDWLMYYDLLTAVQKKLLGVLFGLNSMYVHHPAFKWIENSIKEMKIAPENLYARFSDILTGVPQHSLTALEELTEEVFALAERHHPYLPVKEKRQRAEFTRPHHQ